MWVRVGVRIRVRVRVGVGVGVRVGRRGEDLRRVPTDRELGADQLRLVRVRVGR